MRIIKGLFGKCLCLVGLHDIERLPPPAGYMGGVFSPYQCKRDGCFHCHSGFPYPKKIEISYDEYVAMLES